MNEAILNMLKHRKTNDKSKQIKNKKNTAKDYNIKNNLNKNTNNVNENDNIFLNEASMEYYNKHVLPITNIKKYNSTVRSFKEDLYKWKLLHKRLLLSSKINSEDTELSSVLRNEAYWLKNNQKTTVIVNKSNIFDKTAPSVKNSKENYNIYTLPTKYDVKNKLIEPKENITEITNG
jgi:hypothetical protein